MELSVVSRQRFFAPFSKYFVLTQVDMGIP
jgi:hypothetical protein